MWSRLQTLLLLILAPLLIGLIEGGLWLLGSKAFGVALPDLSLAQYALAAYAIGLAHLVLEGFGGLVSSKPVGLSGRAARRYGPDRPRDW